MNKIHHIGLVVSDLPETLSSLGLTSDDVRETVYDPVQKNKLHFVYISANDLWLEFVEPTSEEASTWTFAQKFGAGLHHLGFWTEDMESEEQHADRPGTFILGRYQIDVSSFGGAIRTLFVSAKGLIVEYVTGRGKLAQ